MAQLLLTSMSAAMAAEVALETTEQALRAGHDRRIAGEEAPELQPQPTVGLQHEGLNRSVLETVRLRYRLQEEQREAKAASLQHRSEQLNHDVQAAKLKSEHAFFTAALSEQSSMRGRLAVALGEAEEAATEARQLHSSMEWKAAEQAAEVAAAQAEARRAAEHAQSLEADLRFLRREAQAVSEGPTSDFAEDVTQRLGSKLLDCESWVELSCLRAEGRLLREELQQSEKTMKMRLEKEHAAKSLAKDILGPALDAGQAALAGLKDHTNRLQNIFDEEQFPEADVVAMTWKFVRALQAASAQWSMARLGAGSEKPLKVKFSEKRDKTWPAILAAADSTVARVVALQQQVQHQSA